MPSVFYLDLWPISNSLMMIHDPEAAYQITQAKNLPKHPINLNTLGSLTGERSVALAEGAEWKMLRSILNPGFSLQYLSTLIPLLVRHGKVFKHRISHYASSGEIFPIYETATSLTIDVIGEVVLGKNFDSQRQPNKLTKHFAKAVQRSVPTQDFIRRNLNKPVIWWHCHQQDILIDQMIRERHAETRSISAPGTKAAVDIFLQAYRDEKMGNSGKKTSGGELDPDFMLIARSNIKTLLLGGHDTTSSTIVYSSASATSTTPSSASIPPKPWTDSSRTQNSSTTSH